MVNKYLLQSSSPKIIIGLKGVIKCIKKGEYYDEIVDIVGL